MVAAAQPVSLAKHEAEKLDARVRAITSAASSLSLELGGLLIRIKKEKAYRTLGFKWFKDYVESRHVSQGYAERLMRASRLSQTEPLYAGLNVDKIIFVDNVSNRPGSGRTKDRWVEFARTNTGQACREEKKRLSRAGIFPVDGRGRVQSIKHIDKDISSDMTIWASRATQEAFRAKCKEWELTPGAALQKLLDLAGGKGKR